MTTLGELLEIDGVVAAGEFSRDGELIDFETTMNMTEELAANAAQFCASVTMMFDTLGGSFTELSGMNWSPQEGWMYAGGEYTVAIGGTTGVFVETEKADFNQLYEHLTGG